MRNGGSGLQGAATQAGSFICLFFISRPQSTGTDSPHSSWCQNSVLRYIVASAELRQGTGTKVGGQSGEWIAERNKWRRQMDNENESV